MQSRSVQSRSVQARSVQARSVQPSRLSGGAPATHAGALAVVGSALGFGLNPFFASRAFAAGVTPEAASLLRTLLLFVVLVPFARRVRGWRREAVTAAAGGAASMAGFAAFYIALDRGPATTATVIYYSYPAVVLAFSALVLRHRVTRGDWALAAAIAAGVVLCIGAPSAAGTDVGSIVLALSAPLGWGVFLVLLAGPLAAMPTAPKMLSATVGGLCVLTPLTLASVGPALVPMTGDALGAVVVLSVCSLGVPALLVTWGAPLVGGRTTALVGGLEFVVALVAGWILLHQQMTLAAALGAALVLVAAMLAGASSSRRGFAAPARVSPPAAT